MSNRRKKAVRSSHRGGKAKKSESLPLRCNYGSRRRYAPDSFQTIPAWKNGNGTPDRRFPIRRFSEGRTFPRKERVSDSFGSYPRSFFGCRKNIRWIRSGEARFWSRFS